MPRTTSKKTAPKKVLTMPSAATKTAAAPSRSDVERRAFELYCQRGCQHGFDVEDWLQAEQEIFGATSSAA